MLTAIVALAAAGASLFIDSSWITFPLAVIVIFFIPGYALSRLIFGRDLKMDMFILISIGISLLASILIALSLAISPIGLTQESALASLLGVTLLALLLDKIRHRENARIEIEIIMPKRSEVDPVLVTVIVFCIIVTGAFAVYILTSEQPTRTHVILMSDELDDNLPNNCTLGDYVRFKVELMNGEGGAANFRLELFVNGTESDFRIGKYIVDTYTLPLENLQTKLLDVSVSPTDPGEQMIRVDFYIDDEYYGELHFWVNVLE
jgi:uncharacterized membrane protein